MIFLTIVITILPNYKVKAMTLIDNSYLPPLVQDDYTDYIIYKTKNSEIYMIKFNYSDNLVFYTSSSNSNGNFYIECKRLDDSEVNIYYNKYFFDRRYEDINDWNWLKSTSFIDTQYLRAPIGGNKYDSSVKEIQSILYSTVDMYYNPSETSTTIYSSDSNLIPGEHKHDSSLSFNEKKLEDKTYSKDNGNYEKDIIVSTIDLYQDNVSKVQAIFNFSDYYDNNYKYYIKPQGKETIDVTNEVLNGTSINGKGYVSLTFEKSTKLVAQVLRNQSDLGINKVFDVKVKTVSNKFESNDGESYPDKPNDGYLDYIVYKTKDNSVFMITFNKTKNYSFFTSDTNDSGGFYIVSYLNKGGENINTHNSYKLDNGTWKVLYQNQYLSNPIGGSKYDSSVKNVKSILYSTVDMYYLYDRTSTGNYSSDSYMIQGLHQNNMSLPLDYRRFNDKTYNKNIPIITEPIEINFEFFYLDENGTEFTDMNGNIYKKLKVKFGEVYNENYKYMISFDNKNWFDVSKQFKQNDDSYIPNAYFNIPISSTIYAKVTKKDDTLISENSITIELDKTLEKVGYINNEYMNLKYVEFEIDNILQGFSPTRFAVQYGTNSDVSNMPNYLKYEVIIEDKNQNPINIDLNEYYFFKEGSLQYKDKIKGVVLDIININHKIPSNAENLKVRFYFNNTEDYYMNFYTTNPKFNTKIDYYDDFFSNYKKYKFPKGYTKAIIKPINKNSSNGNVLFMKKFTNSDIDFFYYNFNSYSITKNIFETAQRDLTEYNVEGYNDVFRKYDFSIDVENKIYPIIHNKREKYCLGGQDIKEDYNFISGWSKKQCEVSEVQHVFYLPNDYYVEFVNLETDSKIVKNISDEDFGEDDTLDINNNFKDQMNEKYPFYNEENNKLLNKLNNYIEQLKSMYLDYFPFIGQLKEIYDIFNINISEDTKPPNWTINVEFKPLGIKYENLKVIDFTYFDEYKPLVFNFEKLFLSIFTIIGIVNNIKKGSV
ncbi:MAG: hypothetical protein MR263_02595 [Acholeplasma sp.]|nr:hypothetical protein [Acholeplasma sp.]